MGFLDKTLDKLKGQAAGLLDPFATDAKKAGGGLGDGGFLDGFDQLFGQADETGAVKPQFASKAEAEVVLFTSQPDPVPEDSPDATEFNEKDSDNPEYGKRRQIRSQIQSGI